MRLNFILGICMLLVLSCGNKDKEQQDEAKQASPGGAAIAYYNHLIKGEYKEYVDGMLSCDSIPDKFRQQMVLLVKQYAVREKRENGGLDSVSIVSEQMSDNGRSAKVFLSIRYKDGKKENVVVPLLFHKKIWRMQ